MERLNRSLLLVTVLSCLVLVAFVLTPLGTAAGQSRVRELILRLHGGEDFRVRVQAALELGKTGSQQARTPLERALDDKSDAVRVASAAALKTLGDERAIPALKRHRLDRSPLVRDQVRVSIAALRHQQKLKGAKLVVKLGSMKNATEVRSSSVVKALTDGSRLKLGELPGVAVLPDGLADELAGSGGKLPMVMVSGKIRRLNVDQDVDGVIYSASVEYILHTMPDQSLAATVSGSASTRASVSEAQNRRRSAELRAAVLDAAIESAVRRAPPALMAAARL